MRTPIALNTAWRWMRSIGGATRTTRTHYPRKQFITQAAPRTDMSEDPDVKAYRKYYIRVMAEIEKRCYQWVTVLPMGHCLDRKVPFFTFSC